ISGRDLNEIWGKDNIKVLVGCAPCQPFSTHSNKIKDKELGSKWYLLNEYLRLIEETNPLVVSMENVTNLANKDIFHDFVQRLEEMKYIVSYKKVFCPDYGIPQNRRRLVLLASKLGKIELLPPTHTKSQYMTVREAIGSLPKVKDGECCEEDVLHFTSKLSELNMRRILSSVPNGTWETWDDDLKLECHKKQSGKTYKSVYGRMAWDEPSPTITTQFYNYGTGRFGHPEQNRALTIREASILQTFPEDYLFVAKNEELHITQLGTHIGNAVPVKLGYIIGQSILSHINKHKE
ncbi:MAG: DNA cytosine methyltransferase, partial [Candidatus Methanofastidiosa archaeon]|nr:DNA cytosine methyltransferase [Candidatus Methanofastidiosa archaeon]